MHAGKSGILISLASVSRECPQEGYSFVCALQLSSMPVMVHHLAFH